MVWRFAGEREHVPRHLKGWCSIKLSLGLYLGEQLPVLAPSSVRTRQSGPFHDRSARAGHMCRPLCPDPSPDAPPFSLSSRARPGVGRSARIILRSASGSVSPLHPLPELRPVLPPAGLTPLCWPHKAAHLAAQRRRRGGGQERRSDGNYTAPPPPPAPPPSAASAAGSGASSGLFQRPPAQRGRGREADRDRRPFKQVDWAHRTPESAYSQM